MIVPKEKRPTKSAAGGSLRIIGLTGGIASGKTEVARVLVEHGVAVISADEAGHRVIAPGGPGEEAVIEAFGEGILSEGAIDRSKLGRKVFGDSEALQKLNEIVHPLIAEIIAADCALFSQNGATLVVIDAALLAENGEPEAYLDGLIVVHSDREKRAERLVGRGLSSEEAACRMDAQTPPELKLQAADWVIENDDSLESLHSKAAALAEELKKE